MKKCSHCGKIYADASAVCELDGQPLWAVNPPQLPGTQPAPFAAAEARSIIDNEHLRLLAIFQYVFAGLSFAGLLFLGVHFLIMSAVFSNPGMWQSSRNPITPPPEFLKTILACFYAMIGGIIAIIGVLNLLSANFIRHRKHRTFSFVAACVNCLQVPFGTALGVFTIIVLSRPSVRMQYGEQQG